MTEQQSHVSTNSAGPSPAASANSAGVGPVDIRVPAEASLSRVMRLAASGLASLGDFTVDDIEDIKIAVSEVLIALIEHGDGHPIDIRFEVAGPSFEIRGTTGCVNFDVEHPDLALCRAVLDGVAADHRIEVTDAQVTIWAHVVGQPG